MSKLENRTLKNYTDKKCKMNHTYTDFFLNVIKKDLTHLNKYIYDSIIQNITGNIFE